MAEPKQGSGVGHAAMGFLLLVLFVFALVGVQRWIAARYHRHQMQNAPLILEPMIRMEDIESSLPKLETPQGLLEPETAELIDKATSEKDEQR